MNTKKQKIKNTVEVVKKVLKLKSKQPNKDELIEKLEKIEKKNQ